jgi:hypothetical protein
VKRFADATIRSLPAWSGGQVLLVAFGVLLATRFHPLMKEIKINSPSRLTNRNRMAPAKAVG